MKKYNFQDVILSLYCWKSLLDRLQKVAYSNILDQVFQAHFGRKIIMDMPKEVKLGKGWSQVVNTSFCTK
jgi:hypothetical protein